MNFRFKEGDAVRAKNFDSFGHIVWLEDDGQYAVKVDRNKHGMEPWIYKTVCWNEWCLK